MFEGFGGGIALDVEFDMVTCTINRYGQEGQKVHI